MQQTNKYLTNRPKLMFIGRGLIPSNAMMVPIDGEDDDISQSPRQRSVGSAVDPTLISDAGGISASSGNQLKTNPFKTFFSKLNSQKSAQDAADVQDDIDTKYGLNAPERKKESLFSKIADYAIPAALSIGSDEGIVPALAGTYMAKKAASKKDYQTDLENYRIARKEAIGQEKEYRALKRQTERDAALDDYRNRSLDAMSGYRDRMSDLAEQRFGLQTDKFKSQLESKAKGKIIPASKAEMLGDGAYLPSVLNRLSDSVKEYASKTGPIEGRLRRLNPYDRDVQNIRAQTDLVRQMVGKFLEGGILKKEDEEKYKKILAEVENTPETSIDKINNVKRELVNKYNIYLDSYKRAGYDVSGYEPLSSDDADDAAIEWAKQNPNDPDAQEILRLNGM